MSPTKLLYSVGKQVDNKTGRDGKIASREFYFETVSTRVITYYVKVSQIAHYVFKNIFASSVSRHKRNFI